MVPLERRHETPLVQRFAKHVVRTLAQWDRRAFTVSPAKSSRQGRIYLDIARNSPGAMTVAAYSTRARPQAPVSTPLSWDELAHVDRSDQFTVTEVRQRAASETAPWYSIRQSITAAAQHAVGMR